jgi:hypothetical protein
VPSPSIEIAVFRVLMKVAPDTKRLVVQIPARALAALGLAGVLFGCAASHRDYRVDPELAPRQGRAVDAANEAERTLLTRAPELPAGERVVVAGLAVVPGPLYQAASGHLCRDIHVAGAESAHHGPEGAAGTRLVCGPSRDSGGWFFAPPVLAGAVDVVGQAGTSARAARAAQED